MSRIPRHVKARRASADADRNAQHYAKPEDAQRCARCLQRRDEHIFGDCDDLKGVFTEPCTCGEGLLEGLAHCEGCPRHTPAPVITPTRRGFTIERPACIVCGEPPFGTEYACGHSQVAQVSR